MYVCRERGRERERVLKSFTFVILNVYLSISSSLCVFKQRSIMLIVIAFICLHTKTKWSLHSCICMRMYVYINTYVHTHTYIHTCTYACILQWWLGERHEGDIWSIRMYIYIYIHTHTYIYTYTQTYAYACIWQWWLGERHEGDTVLGPKNRVSLWPTHTCTHSHTFLHMNIQTCIRTLETEFGQEITKSYAK
jgi:hypothetical protein